MEGYLKLKKYEMNENNNVANYFLDTEQAYGNQRKI